MRRAAAASPPPREELRPPHRGRGRGAARDRGDAREPADVRRGRARADELPRERRERGHLRGAVVGRALDDVRGSLLPRGGRRREVGARERARGEVASGAPGGEDGVAEVPVRAPVELASRGAQVRAQERVVRVRPDALAKVPHERVLAVQGRRHIARRRERAGAPELGRARALVEGSARRVGRRRARRRRAVGRAHPRVAVPPARPAREGDGARGAPADDEKARQSVIVVRRRESSPLLRVRGGGVPRTRRCARRASAPSRFRPPGSRPARVVALAGARRRARAGSRLAPRDPRMPPTTTRRSRASSWRTSPRRSTGSSARYASG